MKTVKIGLLGLGVVNRGFCDVVKRRHSALYAQGYQVVIKAVCVRDTERAAAYFEERRMQMPLITTEPERLFEDAEIDIVVEAISGAHPAGRYIAKSLENGKHVITANKAALAENYEALQYSAAHAGKRLLFEGAVCGGVPVVQTLERLMRADDIVAVSGIFNGTSNFILSEMAKRAIDYETALKEAQELGYAEADPSADVDGIDSANKLAVLCGLIWGKSVAPQTIDREGIRGIRDVTPYTKLVATARRRPDGELETAVKVVEVAPEGPLADAEGPDNYVVVESLQLGQLGFSGPGAGGEATGTALYLDLLKLLDENAFL
ncbi:homoserine dehydrogenase [Fusibacter sp. JL298sf-3]